MEPAARLGILRPGPDDRLVDSSVLLADRRHRSGHPAWDCPRIAPNPDIPLSACPRSIRFSDRAYLRSAALDNTAGGDRWIRRDVRSPHGALLDCRDVLRGPGDLLRPKLSLAGPGR